MAKIDFKKLHKELYNPSAKQGSIVDVPSMNFIMLDGQGDPNNSEAFINAVEALYGTAYSVKFMLKKAGVGDEYVVPPLEGLWWIKDMVNFSLDRKDDWEWTLMIMQPEWVEAVHILYASLELSAKKDNPSINDIRFENFAEGLSAQIMHIGPYTEEAPTIKKLHVFIKNGNYDLRDKHHEIYLSDPRRADPKKMKTVIRQPIINKE